MTADSAEINGGMRYIPKTDGQRNNLYERIFITNSPVYEETLPTIANPPSLRQQEGKQVVWTVTAPETFQADHERCRAIRSYGLDKIMQHSHEVTWRDEGDSFTMRLHAAPQKGGDAMLKWYIKAQNDMGWLQGVYTNYTDFAPVNTNWNPDHVQREPDGEWRRAWPRNYALKPAKAVEFDEYYAKRIKEKFGVEDVVHRRPHRCGALAVLRFRRPRARRGNFGRDVLRLWPTSAERPAACTARRNRKRPTSGFTQAWNPAATAGCTRM